LTGYQKLKHSNYLITISLYRDSTKALAQHDGKYCAIPACHRDSFQSLPGQFLGRLAAPVTQTTSTAVPLGKIPGARGTSQDSVIFQDYHIKLR